MHFHHSFPFHRASCRKFCKHFPSFYHSLLPAHSKKQEAQGFLRVYQASARKKSFTTAAISSARVAMRGCPPWS